MHSELRIKFSIPGAGANINLSQFTGNNENKIGGIKFYVNDPSCTDAIAWFVFEDPLEKGESCNVPIDNIFYLSAESSYPIGWYDQHGYIDFFSQFSRVVSCHPIRGIKVEFEPPYLPWMINSNHGDTIYKPHFRDINYFRESTHQAKKKQISVICSNQQWQPTHQLRYRFVEQLKQHFGERLDWYGNGVNPINEKWDAIAPYKYHIVLENQARSAIITEKLGDSYLGNAYPIYWGAPNIDDYFPSCPKLNIDILNPKSAISYIEEILLSNAYESATEDLLIARNVVIDQFNFLNRIVQKVKELKFDGLRKEITLLPREYFIRSKQKSPLYFSFNLLGRSLCRLGNKLIDQSR